MISTTLRTASLIIAAVFTLSLATWGQSCSNSSLSGAYGFAGTGTDASANPVALAGLYNADGNGNLTGTQTESVNGTLSLNVPISGTYTINSNCNGTATITPKGGPAAHYNLTLASAGSRAFSLETDSGTIITMYSRAVMETSCSTSGTNGTFGFTGTGSIVGVGNIANSGQMVLNGAGKLSGTESSSIAGQIFSNVPFTGTYKVNKNCTGTAVLKIKGQSAIHINFALVRQLASIFFIETDANTVVAGWDRE